MFPLVILMITAPEKLDKPALNEPRWNGWKWAQFTTAILLLFGGIFLITLPDVSVVERLQPVAGIQIFDRYDKLATTVDGDPQREKITLDKVSPNMRAAILAAEDRHFYQHGGVNPISIGRALLSNMHAGRIVEGGSTISQQLAKNIFFEESQRSWIRKIKEILLAVQIEAQFPKDKILELYLNQIYFGNSAYGIERAAQRYFGKSAAQLSLAESAYLAGIVKAPSVLGDTKKRQLGIARQREILNKMAEYGMVTSAQVAAAKRQKLTFKKGRLSGDKYAYYVSYVMEKLADVLPSDKRQQYGLRVFTNLDRQAQVSAEQAIARGIKRAPSGVNQGALVSQDVDSGAIIAIVGGAGDYLKNQWNRALYPHTAGSAFKPFVYLTGLANGAFTADSLIDDAPIVITQRGAKPYSPRNFDGEYWGTLTVRDALVYSRNICSIKAALAAGLDNVVNTARTAGITSRLDNNVTLALGSSAVSPMEMASAYGTIARGGVAIQPHAIRRVEEADGDPIYNYQPTQQRVFNYQDVANLVDILKDVVLRGTGTGARLPAVPVAGKTGTADGAKDIWFVGFTPDVVTAVWGGSDQNKQVYGSHVTGGSVMASIWRRYNEGYYVTHRPRRDYFIAALPQQKTEEDDVGKAVGFVQNLLRGVGIDLRDKVEPKKESGEVEEYLGSIKKGASQIGKFLDQIEREEDDDGRGDSNDDGDRPGQSRRNHPNLPLETYDMPYSAPQAPPATAPARPIDYDIYPRQQRMDHPPTPAPYHPTPNKDRPPAPRYQPPPEQHGPSDYVREYPSEPEELEPQFPPEPAPQPHPPDYNDPSQWTR